MHAFNGAMTREFRTLWEELRQRADVHVAVLRATPGKAFCIGVDLKEGWQAARDGGSAFESETPGDWLGPKSNGFWKPFIVAVSGMAAAGAFYWLNEADIAICSEEATFFDTHLSFGTVSSTGPVGALARMPFTEVLRMALLSNEERITAATALRIHLVSEVVRIEELWPRAHDIASNLAAKNPAAVEGTLRALWDALSLPYSQALRHAGKYSKLGNPAGFAGIDRTAPRKEWRPR